MARTIQTTFTSFLSTAIFFATFFALGDVLIAASAAVVTAIAQYAVRRSRHRNSGVLMWASLALVLVLTGLSVKGDDAYAATLSQAQMTRQLDGKVTPCSCRAPAHVVAQLIATPAL